MAEIVPGVHLVDGLVKGRLGSNVYLLVDDFLTLIDAGLPGSVKPIAAYVESLGRNLDQLRYILITHSHPDHTGGAPTLRERTGAQVLAHEGDLRPFKNGYSVSYMGVFGAADVPVPFLRRVPADGWLWEGEEMPILGGLVVRHTPGHTPGSVCFELKREGVLFCGDMLVERDGVLAKNRAFPGSRLDDYDASLHNIAAMDYGTLCPGHGQPVTPEASRLVRRLVAGSQRSLTWRPLG